MSSGNGAVHDAEAFEMRVRRLELVVDDRDAKTLAAIAEVREMLSEDRTANRDRHAEVLRILNDLAERTPARRTPKMGKR